MATPVISAQPLPLSIVTPPRDSMTFTSTKGLLNGPGQNNCFLNSAVQVLWHLDIFRRSFRDLSGHACMADSCIFCALKELFSQLQFSNETALPPDALRRALAESFFDQQRFQLGFMDDAAECFENMLLRIHMHIAHGEAEDMCNARHCIPHQKFAMTLVEQSICGSCGATSEPLSYTQMVHYVSTSTLVYQVRTNANRPPEPFGQLLRKAGSMGDVRVCPSACGAAIQIGRTLMNRPEIVSIGLVWNSERPTLEHIMEVFSTIGTNLRLGDVFNTVVDSRWSENCIHNLVGVVTYYGKHYSTFFFHTKLRVWIYFDDATVREVGPRWEQVVEKCRKGRYQPLLLLYALPDGTPVNTENAPKQITPFYNDKKNKPPQQIVRRSVTPSPEKPNIGNTRRAITPNPDGTFSQKPPLPRTYNEYQNLSVIQNSLYGDGKQVHRTLSNGSSSGVELSSGEMNVPRRRDSGNWSGDRNSASSSSSTTMDNPYLYLVGKVPPGSPTRTKSDSSSGSSGVYDCGYDSYSLSSNDSSTMTTIQHLMKMGHLAKIPEDYNTQQQQPSQSCDVLCDEADQLLVKSRQLEDEHDLVLALALCNAAATKARAAMNAPYNNPQTLTLARMKHNTCIMRARSLHRRMTQTQNNQKDQPLEIRHTREGSSGSGRHSRQNSRDKGQHSRQNSRELLQQPIEKTNANKNIEIYATLPKKKDSLKKMSISIENDDDYVLCEKNSRESRSIFSKSKKDNKIREKRSRSEDRNKITTRDFTIAPEIITAKDTLKREKNKDDEKKEKDKTKKQHKIRRKLLMGGLIKRKNRSMPDLTDPTDDEKSPPTATVDDSKVGLNKSPENGMCGYLSEGHLEFTGNSTNPNLERSKLMRKSFHGSAGKILTAAKVPPPPPLRTTSQLSKTKLSEEQKERPPYPLPTESFYQNHQEYHNSIPYDNNNQSNTIITRADVHQDNSNKEDGQNIDSGVDEVDCLPSHSNVQLDLPPYPSPLGSAIHSRQASEEFPPPPPPLDLSALEEHLVEKSVTPPPAPGSLLAQLQNKRQEILSQDFKLPNSECQQQQQQQQQRSDMWLKELQAKQAALRMRKQSQDQGQDVINTQRYAVGELDQKSSVKDLANKFESIKPLENYQNGVLSIKKRDEIQTSSEIKEEQKEEIKNEEGGKKCKIAKKKSVSFCDQVILVATAEEQEDDSFIPNPILERVLRSAMNKPETAAIRQEILNLRENENKSEGELNDQPVYVRRNSIDLLIKQNSDAEYSNSNSNGPTETPFRQSPYQKVPPPNYLNSQDSYSPYSPQQFPQPPRIQEQYPKIIQEPYSSSPRTQDQYLPPQEQYVSRYQDQTTYSSSPRMSEQYLTTIPPRIPDQYVSSTNKIQDQYSAYYPRPQEQYIVNHRPQDQYTVLPRNQEPYSRLPLDSHQRLPPNHDQPSRLPLDQYRPQTTPEQYSRLPADQYSISPRTNQEQQYPSSQQMRVPDQYAPYKIPPEPYSSAPRLEHPPLQRNYSHQQVRQSPNPHSYPHQYPVYQHPPSPVPSINSNYNYQQQPQPHKQYPPYQRIPLPADPHRDPNYSTYQRPPQPPPEHQEPINYNPYQPVPTIRSPPASHIDQDIYQFKNSIQNKQLLKKSVSFEPGTKGGGMESPTPKAVVTPIIVNNANNSVPMGKTKCNLCRKKVVVSSNLYCTDCEFYMSRFKPKC